MELILKLTERCNYGCSFCRYANHRRKDDGMSVTDIERLMRECAQYNLQRGKKLVTVNFHGGEPLLFGLERFQTVMESQRRIERELQVTFQNSIQSNGALLDEMWCGFLRENNISIGLSFDGPGDLNQHKPLDSEDTEARFLQTARLLNGQNIPFGVISVITPKHIGREQEFLDFFGRVGIRELGLSYCYNAEDDCSVDPVELAGFLIRLFEMNLRAAKPIKIREFSEPIRRFLKEPVSNCFEMKRCACGLFMTVTPAGDVTFCDDDNLNRKIGNIHEQSLEQLMDGEARRRWLETMCTFHKTVCGKCEIGDLCGGGCSRYDLGMKRNYFCETYKVLYPYLYERVQSVLRQRDVLSVLRLKRLY